VLYNKLKNDATLKNIKRVVVVALALAHSLMYVLTFSHLNKFTPAQYKKKPESGA